MPKVRKLPKTFIVTQHQVSANGLIKKAEGLINDIAKEFPLLPGQTESGALANTPVPLDASARKLLYYGKGGIKSRESAIKNLQKALTDLHMMANAAQLVSQLPEIGGTMPRATRKKGRKARAM